MKYVRLSSLSVNDTFRFADYTDKPVGPVYRVTGFESDCVNCVDTSAMFSPVYFAINYAFVFPNFKDYE